MTRVRPFVARATALAGLLLAAAGCARSHTRIQLLDRLDPATQSYRSCRDLHVVQVGADEYFFQYAVRGDGTPLADSLRCRGIVLPGSGTLEVVVEPPRLRDAAGRAEEADASRRMRERLAGIRHPLPEGGHWVFLPGPGNVESCLLTPR